jgi:hypothetical protein
MIRNNAYLLLIVILFTGFCSCRKDKFNALLQPSGNEVASNSSIRLFNFLTFNLDITVNNIPLTSYGKGSQFGTQQGLSIFPKGYWPAMDNGNPFYVPNNLVTKDRKVHILISTVGGQLAQGAYYSFASIDTVLTDDPLHPNDYYASPTGHLLVISRNTEAPVQPDHFKIRVINLGAATDPNNVTGPVKLTYSDGSSVNSLLDSVLAFNPATDTGVGAKPYISQYVDIPYGAYMFKLFAMNNLGQNKFSKQLSELPTLPNLNTCSFGNYSPVTQQAIFPRVRTFKPGATYTIVISQSLGFFPPCPGGPTGSPPVPTLYNGYRIITEQSPGPNTTYARMDAFDALPVGSVSIKIDGQTLGSPLSYMGHTDYGIYVQGTHQVQAVDANGTVLVSKSITLSPYDNYTAWVYESPSGHPDICFANTDMTSTLYLTDRDGNVFTENTSSGPLSVPPVDDGTNGTIRVQSILYSWQTRFLNLTPDAPYITFTDDLSTFPGLGITGGWGDSSNFTAASINLQPGITPDYNPFVIYQFQPAYSAGNPAGGYVGYNQPLTYPPSVIRVSQSTPGPPAVVPGQLLGNVAPLPGSAYITNPALYPDAQFVPVCEPGIYTTALIGRISANPSDQSAGRLIILKHNK